MHVVQFLSAVWSAHGFRPETGNYLHHSLRTAKGDVELLQTLMMFEQDHLLPEREVDLPRHWYFMLLSGSAM